MPAVIHMNVEDEYLMNFYAVAAESPINKLTAYMMMPQREGKIFTRNFLQIYEEVDDLNKANKFSFVVIKKKLLSE